MKTKHRKLLLFLFLTQSIRLESLAHSQIQYDLVLEGDRVIDPQPKLEAISNAGDLNTSITNLIS